MFGNPFIDDDDIVDTTKSKKSNSTLVSEKIEFSDDKTKICDDLVKNSFCSNKKCSESGKHPSKVIICRNMITKGKKKTKLISKGSCSNKKCKFQHPTPKYIDSLKSKLTSGNNFNQKLKIQENFKFGQFYLKFHDKMKRSSLKVKF
jgi:hypothetical protein